MDLSVVIPVKNEQDNILPLLEEIHAALEGRYDYEVIYVDDGSDDASPRVLGAARNTYPRLRVLRHAESCGQSTAVRSGVQAAHAPWIATLDGDGQNDPADIPSLMAVIQAPDCPAELKLIAGWRKTRRDTWLKRLSSKIANAVRSTSAQGQHAGYRLWPEAVSARDVSGSAVLRSHAPLLAGAGAARGRAGAFGRGAASASRTRRQQIRPA